MQPAHPPESDAREADNSLIFWNVAVIFLIFCGFVVVASRTVADPDLWGHLRFGLDTTQNKGIIQVDPYSYMTTGQRWINHEWLAEVTFAIAWLFYGPTGLVILKTAIWAITYAILFWCLAKYPLVPLRAGILLFLSMTVTLPFIYTVRPQSYSALLYTLLLLIIIQAENGRYRWLWACLLIFALWPNLHGAFPAGLGVLAVWAFVHLLTHRRRGVWLQVIPPLLLSGVATLINPYGVDLLAFIFSNLDDPRLEITEWRPLRVHSLMGISYLFWLILAILGIVFSRKQRRPALLILLAITAYLPFIASRFGMFFILTALVIAGEHIGDTWDRIMPAPKAPKKRPLWISVTIIFTALALLIWRLPNFASIPVKDPRAYPQTSVSLLQQSGVSGNLAVHFEWGDYAIWHLTPSVKVSLDTRREMAYSDDLYKVNVRYILGIGEWASLLEDYSTDMALVKSASANDNLMKQRQDWVRIHQDEVSALYALDGSHQADVLLKAAQDIELVEHNSFFP
ncbi:hypothetical protein ACFLV7_11380 [Chloroflexota bacterium]